MSRRHQRLAAIVLFVGALVLGLHRVGHYSLWNDEGLSVAEAHLHLGSLMAFVIHRDPDNGLYALILHYWIALFGDSEAWIRSISAIFGAFSAVALWFVLRRLISELVALLSVALFVLNGFFVAYSQEARSYALVMFLTCAAMALFVFAVQENKKRWWALWAVVSVLAIYGHPFAVMPVLGAHISLLVAKRRPTIRIWLAVFIAQVLLCGPLILMLATRSQEHTARGDGVSISGIAAVVNAGTGHGGIGMTALICLLVAFALIRTVRAQFKHEDVWGETLIMLWALLLPMTLILVSFVKPVLVPRYMAPSIPAVMTVAVMAIVDFREREIKIGAGVLAAVFALVSVNTYFTHGAKDDWRDATAYVVENAKPGDAVLISYGQRNVFQYYFMRDGGKRGSIPIPLSPSRPWGSPIPVHENLIDTTSPAFVAKAIAPYTRVWSLYLDDEPYQKNLQMGLASVFNNAHTENFLPRVEVTLYANS